MSRSKSTISIAAIALAFALTAGAAQAQMGGAANPAASAAAGVSATDGKDFLGVWDIAFQGAQPVTVALTVRDQGGKLAASANMLNVDNPISSIAKKETALVLSYQIDYQGMPVPIVLTLTPGGGGIDAILDAAGGMLVTNGKAVKRP